MTLIGFVLLYILVTIGIGVWASRRVKDTNDFALAGRSLPLPMVITATFATWFGSETILGLPGRFIESGIAGVIEEPFGSGMALILVGTFFAQKLYRLNILTIGDFYRDRYGTGVEMLCSIAIVISYLGWVGAQVTALGLVLNLITEGMISVTAGMVIGAVVVLFYTMVGGMWSVAWTDFFQMIIIVAGLVAILSTGWLFWISAAMTMMIGSIPQQDVFQRVMSAKDVRTAVAGPIIGGSVYILFAFVPMLIVVAAVLAMPDVSGKLLAEDPQQLLPTLVRDHMPNWLRVIFFGAVLSAVMSTASATMLAPSTTFVENVLPHFVKLNPKNMLRTMRVTLALFALFVLIYSIALEGAAIYDMVAMAYQFPVVGAFWPLVCGLYWKQATRQGCYVSILFGTICWSLLTWTPMGEVFPNVLGGFLVAGIGMVVGSLLPTEGNRKFRLERQMKAEQALGAQATEGYPALAPAAASAST